MITSNQVSADRNDSQTATAKETLLRGLMREMKSVLVAYSGGVDSTYLALVAAQELGQNSCAYLGLSPSVSSFQRTQAEQIAKSFGLRLSTIETEELRDPSYQANGTDRCYFCKSELYGKLSLAAVERGVSFVIDGTNADDVGDHRPGRIAAAEASVRSPLIEAGLRKSEIRELSRRQGLPTWDAPASPCLSSRVATGVPVTIGRLRQVEDGEDFLRSLGFREFRVRVHGETARLEIAKDEMQRAFVPSTLESLTAKFKGLGFRYVTLDLEGFRSGSMNV